MRIQFILFLTITITLAGCSTPKPVMDEANFGVGLLAQLELSLTEFRRVEVNSLHARQASLLEQQHALRVIDREKQSDMRARIAAGDKWSGALIEQLVANTDAIPAEQTWYAVAAAKSETDISALLVPIPSTRSSTSAAQQSLSEMGQELSWSVRRAELQALASAVKKNVDENKVKIADASAKAASGK
jgi:hypothetical protein